MTILKLVDWLNPVLIAPASRFDFTDPPVDPARLATDLVETMRAHGAHGLAAPQVGLSYRVFAFSGAPNVVAFNPVIVDSLGEDEMQEACLSYPGLVLKVKRARGIRVRYTQPNGTVVTEKYGGLTARVFQHELDHLDGLTVLTSVTGNVSKIIAMKKWGKACRLRKSDAPVSIEGEVDAVKAYERKEEDIV